MTRPPPVATMIYALPYDSHGERNHQNTVQATRQHLKPNATPWAIFGDAYSTEPSRCVTRIEATISRGERNHHLSVTILRARPKNYIKLLNLRLSLSNTALIN